MLSDPFPDGTDRDTARQLMVGYSHPTAAAMSGYAFETIDPHADRGVVVEPFLGTPLGGVVTFDRSNPDVVTATATYLHPLVGTVRTELEEFEPGRFRVRVTGEGQDGYPLTNPFGGGAFGHELSATYGPDTFVQLHENMMGAARGDLPLRPVPEAAPLGLSPPEVTPAPTSGSPGAETNPYLLNPSGYDNTFNGYDNEAAPVDAPPADPIPPN